MRVLNSPRFLPVLLLSVSTLTAVGQGRITDSRSGIPVIFTVDENVFPHSWTQSPINGYCEHLDADERERSGKIMLRALAKYPVSLLKRSLVRVYVLKVLEFYGQGYGGTNSNDVVYVANSGRSDGYTDDYIERVFHAEYSSILLRKYRNSFEEALWKKANGAGVVYGTSGVDALRTGKTGQEFDPALNELGILDEYSLSDVENDFNAYAQNIFHPRPGFWELVDTYPAVKRKLLLIIAFYARLDSLFTERYFRTFQ